MLTSGAAPPKRTERSLDSAFGKHSLLRRLSIEIPGGVDHVLNRGVDRVDIVRDDEDRHEWFRLFNRVATHCGALGAVAGDGGNLDCPDFGEWDTNRATKRLNRQKGISDAV